MKMFNKAKTEIIKRLKENSHDITITMKDSEDKVNIMCLDAHPEDPKAMFVVKSEMLKTRVLTGIDRVTEVILNHKMYVDLGEFYAEVNAKIKAEKENNQ